MIHLLSPAKSLDFESNVKFQEHSQAEFLEQSKKLIKKLNSLSKKKVKELMSISDQLAELNANRYQKWEGKTTVEEDSRQAIFAFTGDVYQGLDAPTLSESDLHYAQENLVILSGLYGVLKPLDIMEPYRLEMGTQLKVGRKSNLYEFWTDQITNQINRQLEKQNASSLINLASNEYFKVINKKKLKAEVISPQFKDAKNGNYKIISFYAKKARGMMSRFIIQHQIEEVEDLQGFDLGGYRFNSDLSTFTKPVFTREENQQ
ncbi:MAG: peroxide stress protein YaaA [Vicingaceae bacterium]